MRILGREGCRMATRGRKPTPTAIKELEGNPGKRPLNTKEPKPVKKAPSCPKWLEPEAKKEWRRLAKQMEQIGILTEVDMAAFAGYCQAYARWKEAEEFITQHGSIVKTPRITAIALWTRWRRFWEGKVNGRDKTEGLSETE